MPINCDWVGQIYEVELSFRFVPDVYDALPDCNVEELNKPFTMDELMKSLNMCSPNKAPGPDRIPNSVLRIFPQSVLEVLLQFYNEYLVIVSFFIPENRHNRKNSYWLLYNVARIVCGGRRYGATIMQIYLLISRQDATFHIIVFSKQ